MKRLIISQQNEDKFLGNPIEITRTKSKYVGYRGWIDGEFHGQNYKVFLNPAKWDHTNKPIVIYIKREKIYEWVRLISQDMV